jgi:hypothetical protein
MLPIPVAWPFQEIQLNFPRSNCQVDEVFAENVTVAPPTVDLVWFVFDTFKLPFQVENLENWSAAD